MTPISHALLPLLVAYRWLPRSGARPAVVPSLLVAAFGALPDVLDPHLALEDRLASWSHTLAAGLGVVLLMGVAAWLGRRWLDARIAVFCVFAYLLHLACDAISGGVMLFRPVLPGVVGGEYLTPLWWLVSDGVLLAWAYVVYRWLPLRARLVRTSGRGK